MEAVTIHGSDLSQPMRTCSKHPCSKRIWSKRRRTMLAALVCSLCSLPAVQQSVHAAQFNPSTATELVEAFASAGVNAEDDVIYLGSQTFELTDELVLEPDNGHSLTLRGGTLERSGESDPFRLLNLLEVPAYVDNGGSLVLLEGVQFENGLYINDDLSADGDAGGGALLSNRKTRINNARFVNNRVLGSGSGGAIKHSRLLEISKSLFTNNEATAISKDQLAQGGAIASDEGARLFVGHGYFQSNTADRGGAIYASNKVVDLNITRSAFNDNQAQSSGGGIWSDVAEGGVRISNTSFIANQAPLGGGAFYTQANYADITLFHLTIWGNESRFGMGSGIHVLAPQDGGSISIRNSVIAYNVGGNCSGVKEMISNNNLSSNSLSDDNSCGLSDVEMLTDIGSVFSGEFNYQVDGSIPFMPVAKTSPARNLVPRINCSPFDSRDIPRLDNGFLPDDYCDAGAIEFVPQEFIDMDGDGVRNRVDNCARVSNPLQSDIDGDGRGDECDRRDDRDSDQDIVLNFHDNCPGLSNFLQLDRNLNGIGDACEFRTQNITLAPVLQ